MCICFWACPKRPPLRPSDEPHIVFLLGANRDEALARTTLDAGWHDFQHLSPSDILQNAQAGRVVPVPALGSPNPNPSPSTSSSGGRFLSGRDLVDPSQGAWLLVSPYRSSPGLCVGILTNIYDEQPPPADGYFSRGALLRDWATLRPAGEGAAWTKAFVDDLARKKDRYAGHNLLLFDMTLKEDGELEVVGQYHTNRSETVGGSDRELRAKDLELGGMSNSVMSEPFTKVRRGKAALEEILQSIGGREAGKTDLEDRIYGLLGMQEPVNTRADLPNSIAVPLCNLPGPPAPTPASTASSSLPSPPPARTYGTRLSQVLTVYSDGRVEYVERDRLWLDAEGTPHEGTRPERREEFHLKE